MKQEFIITKLIHKTIIALSITMIFVIALVVILENITLKTINNTIIKQDNKYYYVTKYKIFSHDVDTIKIPKNNPLPNLK